MNKKIKMIGLDLDGTLLNNKKEVTEYTKKVLRRTVEQGVIVLIATGRPISGIPKEMMEFPGMRYVLSSNGARILDLKEKRMIYESLLPLERGKKVLDVFDKYDTFQEIYFDGIGYANRNQMGSIQHYMKEAPMARYILNTRVPVDDIRVKLEEENKGFDKVQALFASVKDKECVLEELEQIAGITVTGALRNNIEVNNEDVNKGRGLIKLGELLGIQREEIMACGDGLNDLDMIREVGFGVVMKNGDERVKEAADYITATNEEDGVAMAIERFVLA